MKHVDAKAVNQDLQARMKYLLSFLQWDPAKDGKLIEACKPVLAPIVNDVVDTVYDHLLKYDITAASFAPKQSQDGDTKDAAVEDLHRSHENIKFRKDFLKGYLVKLVSNRDWSPESMFWGYIDTVGKLHTGATDTGLSHRRNRPALFVDYREINLLLGWVENAVIDIVMGAKDVQLDTKVAIVKALNKFWWIQNDLFARHYLQGARKDAAAMNWLEKFKTDPVFPILSAIIVIVAIWAIPMG
jgi:hypothetical protein